MKRLGFVPLFLVVTFFSFGCGSNTPVASNDFVVEHEALIGSPTFIASDFGNALRVRCSRCGEFYVPCSKIEVIVEPGIETMYLSIYGKKAIAILDVPVPSIDVEKAKIFVVSPEAKLKLQKEGCERHEKPWFLP